MKLTLPRTSSQERTSNSLYVVSATAVLTTTVWYLIRENRKKNRSAATKMCLYQDIKQGFSMRKVPKEGLDMIIIGSGMGGMTVGSIMAQQGKKVLILEQHDVVGGNTHTFEEQGYEFDTGLHYIGGMDRQRKRWFGFTSDVRRWFDYITNSNVEWEKMDAEYDVAIVQKGQNKDDDETFSIPCDWSKLIPKLKEEFPDETESIDKYFQLCRRVEIVGLPIFCIARVLPRSISAWFLRFVTGRLEMFQSATDQVLQSLTSNKKLQGILAYCYGDYGEPPNRGSFMTHATLWNHFQDGAYYPVGGPASIARSVVPIIENSGGKVLVRAPVSSILIDDESSKAVGVEVKGNKIYAPVVVSTVGAPLTYNHLIPEKHRGLLSKEQRGLENGMVASEVSLMSLFIGTEGTAEDLDLPKRNFWVFPSWDHEANWTCYKQDSTRSSIPAVFISFSSVKDPSFSERHPNKQVALVIAPSMFEDVQEFGSRRVKHRGDAYQAKKEQWQRELMKIFLKQFPHLESKIRYTDIGTAVSNDFYLGTHRGAVYGLGHTPERFQQTWLHPTTPIKNLYLSGQDVAFCGIGGAMAGGFLTAVAMNKFTLLTMSSILCCGC